MIDRYDDAAAQIADTLFVSFKSADSAKPVIAAVLRKMFPTSCMGSINVAEDFGTKVPEAGDIVAWMHDGLMREVSIYSDRLASRPEHSMCKPVVLMRRAEIEVRIAKEGI